MTLRPSSLARFLAPVLRVAAEWRHTRAPYVLGSLSVVGVGGVLFGVAHGIAYFKEEKPTAALLVPVAILGGVSLVTWALAKVARHLQQQSFDGGASRDERLAAIEFLTNPDNERPLGLLHPVVADCIRLSKPSFAEDLLREIPPEKRRFTNPAEAYGRDVVRHSRPEHDNDDYYGPTQVARIIDRYAQIWELARPWDDKKVPAYSSEFDPTLWEPEIQSLYARLRLAMWNQPLFRRLQFVRQLSTVPSTRDLDGTHTRLAHSFGTLDTAAALLSRIVAEARKVPPASSPSVVSQLRSDDRLWSAFLIASGIHDVFHGPLGHSLDAVAEILFPRGASSVDGAEAKLDRSALNAQLKRLHDAMQQGQSLDSEPIHQIIREVTLPDKTKATLEFVMSILGVPGFTAMRSSYGPETETILDVLRQLLDGEVDVDRLDYLYRDCFHLSDRDPLDPDAIIKAASIVVTADSLRVVFRPEDEEIVDRRRRELYQDVYYDQVKQGLDAMIQHGFYWMLENERVTAGGGFDPTTVLGLLQLTDHELFHLLQELSGKERHRLPWALIRRGLHGAGFPMFIEVSADAEAVWALVKQSGVSETDNQRGVNFRKSQYAPYSKAWLDDVALQYKMSVQDVAAIILAQKVSTQHPRYLTPIAAALWKAILNSESGEIDAGRFVEDELGEKDPAAQRRHLLNRPLAFLVPTWEFRLASAPRSKVTGTVPILRGYAPPQIGGAAAIFNEARSGENPPLLLAALELKSLPAKGAFPLAKKRTGK